MVNPFEKMIEDIVEDTDNIEQKEILKVLKDQKINCETLANSIENNVKQNLNLPREIEDLKTNEKDELIDFLKNIEQSLPDPLIIKTDQPTDQFIKAMELEEKRRKRIEDRKQKLLTLSTSNEE